MNAILIKVVRRRWWSRKLSVMVGVQRRDEGPIETRIFELDHNEYIEITSEDLA